MHTHYPPTFVNMQVGIHYWYIPVIVMVLGAIHSGTLVTSHLQYGCINTSHSDVPSAQYLCSLRRSSWVGVK